MKSKLWWVLIMVTFGCCKPDKGMKPDATVQPFLHGMYILCEGNYGWGEGSVFYYDTSQMANDVEDAYQRANGFTAGNVVHSMRVAGDTAFLVVNNSNKVEALDVHTLKRFTANTTLTSPRWVMPVGEKLWVTDLYANRISLLNRQTLTTEATVATLGWTEQLVRAGDRVYIALRKPTGQGIADKNQHILVLDATTAHVLDSIKVGGQGVEELCVLPDGRLASGLEKDFTLGDKPSIVFVNLFTKEVQHIDIQVIEGQKPRRLQFVGNQLFWVQGNRVRACDLYGGNKQGLDIFGGSANLTSLMVMPTGAAQTLRLWVADSRDYVSKGIVREGFWNLQTGQFTLKRETRVGVIPGQMITF